jgi:2-polyprenyl-3-methyl-5-hydroxy-6-metoxy-1,4-benzoquinol methylase
MSVFQEAGWSVTGVETNPECRGYAQRVVGVPVQPDVESLPSAMQFDVALLSHVIEHIPDPVEFLNRVTARVRPGGYLYIKVPNYGSWTVRHVVKDRWDAFLPLHISGTLTGVV